MHLQISQLHTYLSLGKTVEQWLGTAQLDDNTIIKRVSIYRERTGEYSVVYNETFDDGHEDFLDVYEFSAVDPDLEFGKIDIFTTYQEALDFSCQTYHCALDKFVNIGMIQEEYRLYKIGTNWK